MSAVVRVQGTMTTAESYLQQFAPAARATMTETRIPASIQLAQGGLESGWGQSRLAREYNNHFGIKARQGEDYCELLTTEYVSGKPQKVMAKFVRYPSALESYAAHARFLSTLTRYRPAMECCGDPKQFALQLQRCGYSTNPQYAEGLMALVREFNLTQYDTPPDPNPATAAAKEQAA